VRLSAALSVGRPTQRGLNGRVSRPTTRSVDECKGAKGFDNCYELQAEARNGTIGAVPLHGFTTDATVGRFTAALSWVFYRRPVARRAFADALIGS
jgi:hypothetical protein